MTDSSHVMPSMFSSLVAPAASGAPPAVGVQASRVTSGQLKVPGASSDSESQANDFQEVISAAMAQGEAVPETTPNRQSESFGVADFGQFADSANALVRQLAQGRFAEAANPAADTIQSLLADPSTAMSGSAFGIDGGELLPALGQSLPGLGHNIAPLTSPMSLPNGTASQSGQPIALAGNNRPEWVAGASVQPAQLSLEEVVSQSLTVANGMTDYKPPERGFELPVAAAMSMKNEMRSRMTTGMNEALSASSAIMQESQLGLEQQAQEFGLEKLQSFNPDLMTTQAKASTNSGQATSLLNSQAAADNGAVPSHLTAANTLTPSTLTGSMSLGPERQQMPEQLAQGFANLVRKGNQTLELQLNPASLGKIQARITLQGDQAQLWIVAPNPEVRELFEQSLPRLSELLQQSGLSLEGSNLGFAGDGQAWSEQLAQEAETNTGAMTRSNDPVADNNEVSRMALDLQMRQDGGSFDAYA